MEQRKVNLSFEKDSKSYKIITKRKNGTIRVTTHNEDPTLTDPQWADQADIDNIMDRFQKTGAVPNYGSQRKGIYADVSEIPDLLGAAIIVRESQNNFNSLPSKIRERFNNDPQEMINFLKDPKNTQEAIDLGILTATPLNNDKLNDDLKATVKKKTEDKPPQKNSSGSAAE